LLEPIETYSYLNQSGCYSLADIDDARKFEELNMVTLRLLRFSHTFGHDGSHN
jgi:myosin heavy subunit